MNGIAISVYDKFEEVGVLVDIIRKNWKNNYYLSLCSNYPNAEKEAGNLGIDFFIQGANIKFSPTMPPQRRHTNLACRVLDTIKKSCLGAIDGGCEHVMHLHSDAWPLNENRFLELIQKIKDKRKKIAVRGCGFGCYQRSVPLGQIDDMFFVFDASYFKKVFFFNYNPLELLPHKLDMHGALVLLLLAKIGIKNIYFYDNYSNLEYWDGKKKIMPTVANKPSSFDPYWEFLHVHTGAFPRSLGKSIQAYYLMKNGITKGENIQDFLKRYFIPKDKLFKELLEIEAKQDLRIKLMGYNPVVFGRDFSAKAYYLNKPLTDKILKLISNLFCSLVFIPLQHINFYQKYATLHSVVYKRPIEHHDNLWPKQDIYEYYRKTIDPDDFPDEYKDFWFRRDQE